MQSQLRFKVAALVREFLFFVCKLVKNEEFYPIRQRQDFLSCSRGVLDASSSTRSATRTHARADACGDIKYRVVGAALSHNYYVLRRSLHLFLHHRISRSSL